MNKPGSTETRVPKTCQYITAGSRNVPLFSAAACHNQIGENTRHFLRIAASRCLRLGAATSRVPASIQVATCTVCTAPIDGTPALAHQARNSSAARAYARRVCGLRMLTAKNSRKRMLARSPAAATSAGTSSAAGNNAAVFAALGSPLAHSSSAAPPWSVQTPPHRDHHGVDDKRAQDRSVGWRDHLRVASSDDAAGNAGRKREDDMARQCPRDHLPRSPQRSPHCSHVLPRPSLAQMMTANSRKRIEARSPSAATSVGRAAEVIGTSWFTDTVRCNEFGNHGSDAASPFRSQDFSAPALSRLSLPSARASR